MQLARLFCSDLDSGNLYSLTRFQPQQSQDVRSFDLPTIAVSSEIISVVAWNRAGGPGRLVCIMVVPQAKMCDLFHAGFITQP